MDHYTATQLAAQQIGAMHQRAANRRLFRQLRAESAADRPSAKGRTSWLRLSPRRSRVVAT
jgi:hypothetical protein